MKSPLNITQGKAEVKNSIPQYDAGFSATIKIDESGFILADVWGKTKNEAKANATLFVEAHNVANETGLSPKMLQDLLTRCENVLGSTLFGAGVDSEISELLAVLQSIRKGGANG